MEGPPAPHREGPDCPARGYSRGGFGGRTRGGNPGGTPDNTPVSPVAEKAKDLQTTLDNKEAKPEEIKAKLAALREAKAKAKEEVTKAQSELREIITARQESVLVMMGVLD